MPSRAIYRRPGGTNDARVERARNTIIATDEFVETAQRTFRKTLCLVRQSRPLAQFPVLLFYIRTR